MRKTIGLVVATLIAAVAAIVLVFQFVASEPSERPPIAGTVSGFVLADRPAPAPAITFTDGDGAEMTLADFRGKVVLVNLWATWCAPCVKELPDLDRLQAVLGGEDFEVLALSSDRGGAETVRPFLERLGIHRLAVYLDPPSAATRAFRPRGLPTSILIDAEGREVGRLEGIAEWDAPEAQDLIRFYIDRSG
ncbi:MAG: TlpA family protein disulfide reductase [Alphaproteobacteria bacterium]